MNVTDLTARRAERIEPFAELSKALFGWRIEDFADRVHAYALQTSDASSEDAAPAQVEALHATIDCVFGWEASTARVLMHGVDSGRITSSGDLKVWMKIVPPSIHSTLINAGKQEHARRYALAVNMTIKSLETDPGRNIYADALRILATGKDS